MRRRRRDGPKDVADDIPYRLSGRHFIHSAGLRDFSMFSAPQYFGLGVGLGLSKLTIFGRVDRPHTDEILFSSCDVDFLCDCALRSKGNTQNNWLTETTVRLVRCD